MSWISRWWKRRRKKRRRIFIFGRWIGSEDPPGNIVDPIVPPDPYNGEIGLSADEFDVIDTNANYIEVHADRTNGFDGAVSVQYRLIPGTALPGVDYTDVSGTLSWASGEQSSKRFLIPVLPRMVSGDFDFTIELHTPTGGAALISGLDTALATIHRRGNGEANFAGANWYKQNPFPGAPTTLTLFVQRDLAFKDTVTVNWHTVDGTALNGVDYTAGSGTLTWVNGDGAAKSIVIPILSRAGGPFPDRSFTVVIDTPTGGIVIGSINPATCTISDAAVPANPTVTASVANQIVDEFFTADDNVLAGDDFAIVNKNILVNAYVGSNQDGEINNIIDSSNEDLLGVYVFFGSNTGIAVGTNGIVIRTTDNGATWFRAYSGVVVHLRGVAMGSATVGWAVGDGGTILKTTDGGSSWTVQTSGTSEALHGVWANSATTAWAVGANGTILVTTDGGTTWTPQTSGTTQTLRGVVFIGTDGWVAGHGGTILETSNSGTTWNAQTSGTSEDLHAVWMRDANNGWAAGKNGTIRRTSDGGANWNAQTSGTAQHINGLVMLSLTVGWYAADGGVIRKTTDGSTWVAQTSNTAQNLNWIIYTEAAGNTVIAVGDNMTIDRTVNGGTAWATVIAPVFVIGPPSAQHGGGIDYSNEDDTFYPTSRFAMGGMIS